MSPSNILLNYVADTPWSAVTSFLNTGHARFAFCDFGLSYIFPQGTPAHMRLRPGWESNLGTWTYQPPDGSYGEEDYDPLAFDVACLGGVFCEFFGVCNLANVIL